MKYVHFTYMGNRFMSFPSRIGSKLFQLELMYKSKLRASLIFVNQVSKLSLKSSFVTFHFNHRIAVIMSPTRCHFSTILPVTLLIIYFVHKNNAHPSNESSVAETEVLSRPKRYLAFVKGSKFIVSFTCYHL